jgi:hypothetical protein
MKGKTRVPVRPLPGLWSIPPPAQPEECVEKIRAGLLIAQQLVSAPTAESLDRCAVCLRTVGDQLRALLKALAKPGGTQVPVSRIHAAREELEHLNVLLQRTADLYFGWIKLLSARKCGYTRTGAPAELTCSRQFAIHV